MIKSAEELRLAFETGDRPTGQDFADLIDSMYGGNNIVVLDPLEYGLGATDLATGDTFPAEPADGDAFGLTTDGLVYTYNASLGWLNATQPNGCQLFISAALRPRYVLDKAIDSLVFISANRDYDTGSNPIIVELGNLHQLSKNPVVRIFSEQVNVYIIGDLSDGARPAMKQLGFRTPLMDSTDICSMDRRAVWFGRSRSEETRWSHLIPGDRAANSGQLGWGNSPDYADDETRRFTLNEGHWNTLTAVASMPNQDGNPKIMDMINAPVLSASMYNWLGNISNGITDVVMLSDDTALIETGGIAVDHVRWREIPINDANIWFGYGDGSIVDGKIRFADTSPGNRELALGFTEAAINALRYWGESRFYGVRLTVTGMTPGMPIQPSGQRVLVPYAPVDHQYFVDSPITYVHNFMDSTTLSWFSCLDHTVVEVTKVEVLGAMDFDA